MFLFKSKQFDPDQFEIELKKVTTKISTNEKKLRKLKTQKKHYQKLLLWYLTAGYVSYFSYVYYSQRFKEPKIILGLILSPLLIGLAYYTFLTIYDYLINNKESTIEYLKNEHEEKIAMLKEKTNFDKTRDLLTRFSDGEDLKEMEKEADEIRKKKMEYMKMIQDGEKGKILEDLQKEQSSNSSFYDHFLNALMGENELGPDKRYALICAKCFTNNGLAPPGKLPAEVTFICIKCGFLNGKQPSANVDNGGKQGIIKTAREEIEEGVKRDVLEGSKVNESKEGNDEDKESNKN